PLQVVNSVFWKLPFRLRLGPRAVFEVGGVLPARIAVINSVDFTDTRIQEELARPRSARPEIASDVLVTLKPVKIPEDTKAAIAASLDEQNFSKSYAGLRSLQIYPEDVVKPLNSLLASYRLICGQEVADNRVRRVLPKDFSGHHTYTLHMFMRRHDSYHFEEIENAVADATPVSPTPFQFGGHLHDIPSEAISKLRHHLRHNIQYAFFSLAFQAEDYMRQTDYLNALLYSVIAFENAHAELIEHVAETRAGCSKARTWAQTLLKEAGISAIVHLTPYLFMEPENRPSDATIEGVIRALRIRNALAHATRDRNRNLKIDGYRSDALLPSIDAVFSYMNAIARQLPD
ncbi:MAG TPA: hypothetical protein VNA25_17320, partial [Phycisphaerae bacterium]|nr:hypothetical protein [Phycisphaerae bacterium]